MTISHSEQMSLTCSQCGGTFSADIWLVLDAQEYPEKVDALCQNMLNMVACPHCGHTFQAGVPFLYHEAPARTVIFAMPPDVEEFVWREQARELHALLVGSIALEERRAYLSDVQIAQDMAGVAHLLAKTRRLKRQPAPSGTATTTLLSSDTPVTRVHETPDTSQTPDTSPDTQQTADPARLMVAMEALISVNTLEELRPVVRQHPVLLTVQAEEMLEHLADAAVEQREYTIAEGLHRARMLLARLRSDGLDVDAAVSTVTPATTAPEPATPPSVTASTMSTSRDLSYELYEALLEAPTPDALADLARAQPMLLEPWVDAALLHTINRVLEEGNERLAYTLEQRRELLTEMRSDGTSTRDDTQEAVEALLAADDEETLAQVLMEYPVLLTDQAQQWLWNLSSDARTHGDEELATYAAECRAMLRKVRDGLAGQ